MPKKAQKANLINRGKKAVSKTQRQKIRTTHRLQAAARVLNIGIDPHAREQSDIVAYIREKGGLHCAVDVLFECLKAERTYYDLYAKRMVCEPDYATRLGAARSLIANEIGEPIKRQQILVGTVESEDQLKQKLLESPALCERVMMLVDEVKRNQQALTLTNSAQNH